MPEGDEQVSIGELKESLGLCGVSDDLPVHVGLEDGRIVLIKGIEVYETGVLVSCREIPSTFEGEEYIEVERKGHIIHERREEGGR